MPCSRSSGSLSMLHWSNSDTPFIATAKYRALTVSKPELVAETEALRVTDSEKFSRARMCRIQAWRVFKIVTLAQYADSMYQYCTDALARTPEIACQYLKGNARFCWHSFMKARALGGFANAHLSLQEYPYYMCGGLTLARDGGSLATSNTKCSTCLLSSSSSSISRCRYGVRMGWTGW